MSDAPLADGRSAVSAIPPYRGETYYERPALNASPWNWMVSGYVWLAGLGGAAQAIGWLCLTVDRSRFAGVTGNARHLATLATAVGAVLLIVDLRTPQRWYNMLRILRPTSPMSFGTYILSAFGVLSGLTAACELLRDRLGRTGQRIADAAQLGAAVTGVGASTYTAALLASTSAPHWAAAPRHLGAEFATASVASAAAALSLLERARGRAQSCQHLDNVAVAAAAVHLVASVMGERHRRNLGVDKAAYGSPATRRMSRAGLLLASAVPIGAYAFVRLAGRPSPGPSVLGAAAILAGGFLLRHGTLRLGIESAKEPRTYFAFAQQLTPSHSRRPKR